MKKKMDTPIKTQDIYIHIDIEREICKMVKEKKKNHAFE